MDCVNEFLHGRLAIVIERKTPVKDLWKAQEKIDAGRRAICSTNSMFPACFATGKTIEEFMRFTVVEQTCILYSVKTDTLYWNITGLCTNHGIELCPLDAFICENICDNSDFNLIFE